MEIELKFELEPRPELTPEQFQQVIAEAFGSAHDGYQDMVDSWDNMSDLVASLNQSTPNLFPEPWPIDKLPAEGGGIPLQHPELFHAAVELFQEFHAKMIEAMDLAYKKYNQAEERGA